MYYKLNSINNQVQTKMMANIKYAQVIPKIIYLNLL